MNLWLLAWLAVGLGIFLYFAYSVRLYVRGEGQEYTERAAKSLLIMGGAGAVLQIEVIKIGVALELCRLDGTRNGTEIRLRIRRSFWSEDYRTELVQALASNGYELIQEDSPREWTLQARLYVEDIWVVGSAEYCARAVHLALRTMAITKDMRLRFRLTGTKSWRIMNRPTHAEM